MWGPPTVLRVRILCSYFQVHGLLWLSWFIDWNVLIVVSSEDGEVEQLELSLNKVDGVFKQFSLITCAQQFEETLHYT